MPEDTSTTLPAALDPQLEVRLKQTLWYTIGKIVDEETLTLGVHATPQYIGSLSELVYAQLVSVAGDVEAFAKHAGRNTVRCEDVMLLGRRNEGLAGILSDARGKVEGEKRKKQSED